MAKKFYITTPIYYPNRPPHIGSAYTTVMADILARYYKSMGYEVFYLTGTDEHGMKLYKEAQKLGISPEEYISRIVPKFKETWKALRIEYDRFIRTTDPDHIETVKQILKRVYEKGDIYKGIYSGLYCVECERYYTKKELIDGKLCPIHLKPVEKLDMEVYYFRLSKYETQILDLLKSSTEFVIPEERKNYLINVIESEGLKDLAISRPKWYLPWGIECPWDPNHTLYVWVDALLNYISGVGYISDRKTFEKFWPADVHLIGKDILWFHAVIWPALLLSAGLKLPKTVFAHGFLTVNGMKISKSLGTDIDPIDLVNKYGRDTIRYYLARAIPFGEDGDFSEKDIVRYHNTELVNEVGNLAYRLLSLADKYFGGVVPSSCVCDDNETLSDLKKALDNYHSFMKSLQIHHAVTQIIAFAQTLNRFLNKTEPWKLWKRGDKEKVKNIISCGLNWLVVLNALMHPFMPDASERLSKQLGLNEPPKLNTISLSDNLKSGHKLGKKEILFKKLDQK